MYLVPCSHATMLTRSAVEGRYELTGSGVASNRPWRVGLVLAKLSSQFGDEQHIGCQGLADCPGPKYGDETAGANAAVNGVPRNNAARLKRYGTAPDEVSL